MEQEFLQEVWQAYSSLSDAQDLLQISAAAARGRIDHAKAHLRSSSTGRPKSPPTLCGTR